MAEAAPVAVNGWRIYAHQLFLDQLEALITEVEALQSLGAEHGHWRRAKFFQQYRLFFRFLSTSKLIVLGWVNDTGAKRAYESNTDAYRMFEAMLTRAPPPATGRNF